MKNLFSLDAIKRGLLFFWKTLVGGYLCNFLIASVLAVGWSFRLAQRTAVKRWWTLSEDPEKFNSFRHAADASDILRPWKNFPNWFVVPGGPKAAREEAEPPRTFRDKLRILRHGLLGSLWQNAKIGAQGIFNVWVLTVIPLIFWQFGWYSGWDNSFNKGYEQFSVGIAISWAGILIFLFVMLYLPMAQARQAVTGNWRTFYQFSTVWGLIQRRRLACLLLAGMYSLLSIPLVALRGPIPMGIGNTEKYAEMTSIELLDFANTYYFWVSVAGFLAFVLLRIFAARIYAGALLESYKKGLISVADLGPTEGRVLGELGHIKQHEPERRHKAVEIIGKAARPPWRFAMTLATLLVWFTFVFQNYAGEFTKYHDQRGFVNRPLVQLPWFRYVPKHLELAAKEERELLAEEQAIAVAAEK